MVLKNLEDWLKWIKKNHPKEIDLSLERALVVAERMGLIRFACPVVVIGGTNGKGSTVAGLETIYSLAGYKVAAFTSPYLFHFNEQIRIEGKPCSDLRLCEVFSKIASLGVPLTLFELTALSALEIFRQEKADVILLEVGLGGRYDAVNVVENDLAIITSIGIDHTEFLGTTREAIAFEKAGILRPKGPAICGDPFPPKSLVDYANLINANLFCQQQAFGFENQECSFNWWSQRQQLSGLPLPRLALQNISTVLMAVELLQDKRPVERSVIIEAMHTVSLVGRLEEVQKKSLHIFDVSHNPESVAMLRDYLSKKPCQGQSLAVFSMLKDKDIDTALSTIQHCIDHWYVAPIQHERGRSEAQLIDCFLKAKIDNVSHYPSIINAYQAAQNIAGVADRIVVFGSFHTVADVRRNGF